MPKLHLAGDGPDGSWHAFRCPGCRCAHVLPTRGAGAWVWNGSLDLPTLTPSILVHSHAALDEDGRPAVTPRCHSFIVNGRIQFLPDSTHALAGQTVELPEWE